MTPPSRQNTLTPIRWWIGALEILAGFAILLACLTIVLLTCGPMLSVLGTPLAVLLITLLLRRRGESWALLGLRRPPSWPIAIGKGVILAAAVLVVLMGLERLLAPYFPRPEETFLDSVRGNPLLYLYFVTVVAWLSQGLGEELLFRGFIQCRLAQSFGLGRGAWVLAVIGQATLFGLMHGYQGPAGIVATGAAGVVFGVGYLATGRNLWPCVIAHAICGTTLISLMYFAPA